MVKMIPPRPPRRGDGTTGSEVDLWKALPEQLPEGFVVYHSLTCLRSDAVQGEVDFLIVHRDHGMLVVECKGGGVFRDEDGVRLSKNQNGTRDRVKAPADQARDQVESVVDKTRGSLRGLLKRGFGKYPLVYVWALAFPTPTSPPTTNAARSRRFTSPRPAPGTDCTSFRRATGWIRFCCGLFWRIEVHHPTVALESMRRDDGGGCILFCV